MAELDIGDEPKTEGYTSGFTKLAQPHENSISSASLSMNESIKKKIEKPNNEAARNFAIVSI
jgi:hypothetical protein